MKKQKFLVMVGVEMSWFTDVIVAGFAIKFELDGGVKDVLFFEFVFDFLLDFLTVTLYDDMEGGVVINAIETANMEVVDVGNAVDFAEGLLDFLRVDVLWGFLEENIENGFGVFKSANDYEGGYADAHNWIDNRDTSEMHDEAANQNGDPAKGIAQHVEVDGLLVDGVAAVGNVSGDSVNNDAEDGKDEHALIINFGWVKQTFDSLFNNNGGAGKDENSSESAAEGGVADVAVGVLVVDGFLAFVLE